MGLDRLRDTWQALGESDALWAILDAPGTRGGGWDTDEFFATGSKDVEEAMNTLAELGIAPVRARALDFGCGVGRLTRALAQRFDTVDGVDLAASMIKRARQLNQNQDRIAFHCHERPDLRLFDDRSFDFVLSLLVLQHMEPELMQAYLREFVRVLRPDGIALFNVPERYVEPEELPPEAWRATLRLIGCLPDLKAGQPAHIELEVTNESPVPWPPSAQVRIGNHWLAPDGTVLIIDDARQTIETAVPPGGTFHGQLDVLAPSQAGEYRLELDLVQESKAWFADRGSSTLGLKAVVAPAGADGASQASRSAWEMHVMARQDVVAVIEEAGGVVLDELERDRCTVAYPSIDYVVARASRL